jgi:hypothetical protein
MFAMRFCRMAVCVAVVALLSAAASTAQEAASPADDQPSASPASAGAEPASAPQDLAGVDPGTLETIVQQLSPESRATFGALLKSDWRDRPQWADMLIALLAGEEMGPRFGWFAPGDKQYDWSWLSARFDANADGPVSPDELPADAPYAGLLFARLDRDHDGLLRLGDFDYAGRQQATPPLMMSQVLGALLDGDSNGRITAEDLQGFLEQADEDDLGFLTPDDLYAFFSRAMSDAGGGDGMPAPDELLSMFFRGELGVWEPGPNLGEEAPDFTLPLHDGSGSITLSQCRGRPVVLIFGSFT